MNRHFNMLVAVFCVGVSLALSACPAYAQSDGNAAFVFAYYPKEGRRALFDEGYRRHLEWHRNHNDRLPWYGWYVTSGDRIGMFIDGTFGISFTAYDERPDITEDGADAAQTMSPFARPAFRRTYMMRGDLSTGSPLEDGQPTPHVQVFYYDLRPGTKADFENAVRTLRRVLTQGDDVPAHTWYELVVGGDHPTYMLMVHRRDWSSYGNFHDTLLSAVGRHFDSTEAEKLLSILSVSVEQVQSEVWSYRSDLSYFPEV